MRNDTPITLAVATYGNRAGAVSDFDRVMAAKTSGSFDHVAVAVITKDVDGHVEVERHDSTAKHLAWGGALVGGALFVIAPPLAPTALGIGGGASAAGLAGAGGIAGHFWHNVPKETIREMTARRSRRATAPSSSSRSTRRAATSRPCSRAPRRSSSTRRPRATSRAPTRMPSRRSSV